MKFFVQLVAFCLSALLVSSQETKSTRLRYPPARRDLNVSDFFYAARIEDPYRWLENPNSQEVATFVRQQNELTFGYLSECKQRKEISERLLEAWRYRKYGRPVKRGSKYFFFAVERGSEVLYVKDNDVNGPRELLNPNTNGDMAYPNYGVSPSGEFIVYQEVLRGEDGPERTGNMRVRRVVNNDIYPDILEGIRNPQVAWTHDELGFFYVYHKKLGEPEPEPNTRPEFYIYYHRVGTPQSVDVLAVEPIDFKEPPAVVDMDVTDDGQFIMIRSLAVPFPNRRQTIATLYMYNLQHAVNGISGKIPITPVIVHKNTPFLKYVTNDGAKFYFRSRIGARNYKLIEIDLKNASRSNWVELIPEKPDYELKSASGVDKDKLFVLYTSDSQAPLAELRYLNNGSLIRSFPLEFGEVFSVSSTLADSEALIRTQKLEAMPQLYTFDASDAEKAELKYIVADSELADYDPARFTSKKVQYKGNNGTLIDMVIMHRKDMKMDGSSFAFLVDRDFELDFFYRIYFSYLKDYNAVVAFPRLEEKGYGFRDSALDDFIAAGEYLVAENYTSPSRLITRGTGLMGLFVAAAVNKKPGLFAAALPSEAAFDMMRFQAGSNFTQKFGSFNDKEGFQRLYTVSPIHNVKIPPGDTQYPAIMIPTPDEYPVPLAFKYIATLQHTVGRTPQQSNPLLIRVVPQPHPWETRNPADYGRYNIDKETDIRCFLEKSVGLKLHSPKSIS